MTSNFVRLSTICWLLSACAAVAQEPTNVLDLLEPCYAPLLEPRVFDLSFPVTAKDERAVRFVESGLGYLHLNERREAERTFRAALAIDGDCALAHWGLALVLRSARGRAVVHAHEAFRRRESTGPVERALIEIEAAALGATVAPRRVIVDVDREIWVGEAAPDTLESRRERLRSLAVLTSRHPEVDELSALLVREQLEDGIDAGLRDAARGILASLFAKRPQHPARALDLRLVQWDGAAMPGGDPVAVAEAARALVGAAPHSARSHEAVAFALWRNSDLALESHRAAAQLDVEAMAATGDFPQDRPHYAGNVEAMGVIEAALGRPAVARAIGEHLIALPRHPRAEDDAQARGERLLAALQAAAPEEPTAVLPDDLLWSPPEAPALKLVEGRTGRAIDLGDLRGRRVLVVFFLGFGCVHCIDQLKTLAPHIDEFSELGIEILTVGTDSVDDVQASFVRAIENETEPLPFRVLSDPDHERFRAWGCYDTLKNEPLHGTFLISPSGRVQFRDIGAAPFKDIGHLLSEARRLP